MKEVKAVNRIIDMDYYEEHFDRIVAEVYPQRRESVLRLKNKSAACMSLAAGLLMQDIIKKECGILPHDLVIQKNENGKPYIAAFPEFQFNISHSGNAVAMAYGNTAVGIDVEKIRANDLSIAKRCFTESEYDYIVNNKYSYSEHGEFVSCEQRFFTIWTMKEAYLKYIGKGLSVPLNSFQVDVGKGQVVGESVKFYTAISGKYVYTICTEENCKVFYEFKN